MIASGDSKWTQSSMYMYPFSHPGCCIMLSRVLGTEALSLLHYLSGILFCDYATVYPSFVEISKWFFFSIKKQCYSKHSCISTWAHNARNSLRVESLDKVFLSLIILDCAKSPSKVPIFILTSTEWKFTIPHNVVLIYTFWF